MNMMNARIAHGADCRNAFWSVTPIMRCAPVTGSYVTQGKPRSGGRTEKSTTRAQNITSGSNREPAESSSRGTLR